MKFYTKRSGNLHGNLYKFLLVMRLTLILLMAGMMQVSAGTYGQQITLNQNNITIKQVFKAIKIQTGYDVLWQPDKLDAGQKINAHFNKTPLAMVIKECISGHNLEFGIQDNSIVLKASTLLKYPAAIIQQDSVIYKGKVVDENNKGMAGATVKITGSTRVTFTNRQGGFAIYGPLKGNLEVTYIGYSSKQLTLNGLDPSKQITITLLPGNNNLGEVNVVSTGYQDIPKERATGSFEVITKEQLQHSSDPNLIKRLEGITTSMNFNNQLTPINSASTGGTLAAQYQRSPLANLTIRGKNTLNPLNTPDNTSGQVLVIIDGIASPYSIDQVDPNDVESITVLKDAAAASIWGARASNGVIVVKTKRGSYEHPLRVSFNTNFNITDKLNLFYKKNMSTSDYIDGQILAFQVSNMAIGTPNLNQPQPLYSPVAEILEAQRVGQITSAQSKAQIDALRGNDIRNDLDKYILRDAFTQGYSIGLDGGSKNVAYRLSGSYNNILNNTVGSGSDRLVLTYSTSLRPLKNLELQANINYNEQRVQNQAIDNIVGANISPPYYPYTRLVNNQGNPISIPFEYRPAFINLLSSTYGKNILDLHFTPLQDMKEGYLKTDSKTLNLNLGANYRLNSIFSVNLLYNYSRGYNEQENLNGKDSFYIRDLVDRYTTPDVFTQQIPLGAFYRPTVVQTSNQTLRGQLNVNKKWGEKNVVTAISGIDVTQNYSLSRSDQYYGYDENTLRNTAQINYSGQLNTLFNNDSGSPTSQIPYLVNGYTDYKLRSYSLYANGAYTYNQRYTLSGSVRKDASSQFGPGTNRTGTPFYSVGGSWNIANESFYQLSFLPRLQLRTTFGYNGNTNPQVTAQPLISYSTGVGNNGLKFATTGSAATNNDLRPERTAVLNFGLDFGLRDNRLSGVLEYYNKKTTDLIASNKVDPSTGFANLVYNTASLRTQGVDMTLNSQNLRSGLFSWDSNFLFSYNRVKVVDLFTPAAKTAGDVVQGSPTYSQGYDLSRLFAYRWAGLDPNTGDPRGYLNGQPVSLSNSTASNVFTNIYLAPLSSAHYFGSAVPVYFGSFRNTFSYSAFSLSVNLLYKLGYYFRRPGTDMVYYSSFFSDGFLQGAEYAQRWQKPGDELHTNVPSMSYPGDASRDNFYQFSDINVLKADHVRLQEINLSYSFGKKNWFIKNPRIYANISNLGVIWRANKLGLDPDIYDYPNPRTYAFGLSANF